MHRITPFLMFEGQAEAAMSFYVSLFPNSKIEKISSYAEGEAGQAGSVQHALFSLNGQLFACIDSPVKHAFTFTPSVSLSISCATEAEVESLFKGLSCDGQVLMALGSYPFGKKFGWVN